MIDVFMIFTMTIPLLEIIGHTYAEHLRLKMAELDEMSDGPKIPLGSPPGGLNFLYARPKPLYGRQGLAQT